MLEEEHNSSVQYTWTCFLFLWLQYILKYTVTIDGILFKQDAVIINIPWVTFETWAWGMILSHLFVQCSDSSFKNVDLTYKFIVAMDTSNGSKPTCCKHEQR